MPTRTDRLDEQRVDAAMGLGDSTQRAVLSRQECEVVHRLRANGYVVRTRLDIVAALLLEALALPDDDAPAQPAPRDGAKKTNATAKTKKRRRK